MKSPSAPEIVTSLELIIDMLPMVFMNRNLEGFYRIGQTKRVTVWNPISYSAAVFQPLVRPEVSWVKEVRMA